MTNTTTYHEEACSGCYHTASTHPDAGNSLGYCGDCGAATCPDCRVEDAATRCSSCAAKFYGRGGDGDVFARADGRVDCKACGHHGSRCQEDMANGTTICHTSAAVIQ